MPGMPKGEAGATAEERLEWWGHKPWKPREAGGGKEGKAPPESLRGGADLLTARRRTFHPQSHERIRCRCYRAQSGWGQGSRGLTWTTSQAGPCGAGDQELPPRHLLLAGTTPPPASTP